MIRALSLTAVLLMAAPACSETNRAGNPPVQARSSTTGLDAGLLAEALSEAETLPRLHSVIVARDGEVVAERVYRGPSLDTPVNIKSASKSVLAALAGIAIGQGLIEGPDQPISDFLGERFPTNPDPRLATITVGHLLSMQAGLGSTSGGNYGAWVSSPNWVRYALAQPFEAEPGGRMIYSSGTSHLLSAVLTEAADRSTHASAVAWLGQPLDIAIPQWPADPQGIYFGGNDMLMSPRGLLKFGELYRNDGVHEGQRVLPEGWVEASWNGRGTSRWSGNPYGYGWWIKTVGDRPVYFAWGYGGQMVFVVPSLDMTVVMTSDPSPVSERTDHVDRLHQLLDRTLIPAAERGA
ncbi:serine hydrolase domain-containing protein [Brevundimonas variabilis]|uniref:CubicO group peptidase (Beta-lactamase class C family) n=1 Tax=Brevundimonas variabilis TaxID=74312 RepID=A0A7W9CGK9_9CAUL|nr:serine hydrolase [Brevundimonas variabilis]MBB5745250.1 CubicO group peptidase (beta-lactamase class C family) [Brevundimonas variabilis]